MPGYSPNRVMRMRDRQGCSIIHSPLPFIRSATSFSLSSPPPRHTDYALFLYPQRRCRIHMLSFEHERQGRKTTRTTDHCMSLSLFVCFCTRLCSSAFAFQHVQACIFKMPCGYVWICFAGALMLCFYMYLCVDACLHSCWYDSFHVCLC